MKGKRVFLSIFHSLAKFYGRKKKTKHKSHLIHQRGFQYKHTYFSIKHTLFLFSSSSSSFDWLLSQFLSISLSLSGLFLSLISLLTQPNVTKTRTNCKDWRERKKIRKDQYTSVSTLKGQAQKARERERERERRKNVTVNPITQSRNWLYCSSSSSFLARFSPLAIHFSCLSLSLSLFLFLFFLPSLTHPLKF